MKLNAYLRKLNPQIVWINKNELRTIGAAPLNSQNMLSYLLKSSLSPVQYALNYMTIIRMKPVKKAINNGMYKHVENLRYFIIKVDCSKKIPLTSIAFLFLNTPKAMRINITMRTIATGILPGKLL